MDEPTARTSENLSPRLIQEIRAIAANNHYSTAVRLACLDNVLAEIETAIEFIRYEKLALEAIENEPQEGNNP